jgi:hypothetical protein
MSDKKENIKIVELRDSDYNDLMRSCRKKGYDYTHDKYNKKTLCKIVNGKLYEFKNGKKHTEIKKLSDFDGMKSTGDLEPLSPFGIALNLLTSNGIDSNFAIEFLMYIWHQINNDRKNINMIAIPLPKNVNKELFHMIIQLAINDYNNNKNK